MGCLTSCVPEPSMEEGALRNPRSVCANAADGDVSVDSTRIRRLPMIVNTYNRYILHTVNSDLRKNEYLFVYLSTCGWYRTVLGH